MPRDALADKGPASPKTWEYVALSLIVSVFFAVCRNEVLHGTTLGQDFPFHRLATLRFAEGTSRWFFMDPTSRPFLYGLGGMLVKSFGEAAGFARASYVFVGFAMIALILLHDLSRRMISNPTIRISAVALIAFLPTTLVTTVVYAADTLSLLPFVLAGWALIRCFESKTTRESAFNAALCATALCFGNTCKATFLIIPFGAALAVATSLRAGSLSAKRAVVVLSIAALIPLAFGYWISTQAKAEEANSPARHSFDWKGTGEMTAARFLGLKASDSVIFEAPVLFQNPHHHRPTDNLLTHDNSVSYGALLALGIFSDVLNFAGNNTVNQTDRPALQQYASETSIRIGLFLLAGSVVSVVSLTLLLLGGLIRPALSPKPAILACLSLALAWYLPLTLILPFVHHVYGWSYWLPRLVLPALWVFFLLLFERIDALVPDRYRTLVGVLIALIVSVESAYGILSVWY